MLYACYILYYIYTENYIWYFFAYVSIYIYKNINMYIYIYIKL